MFKKRESVFEIEEGKFLSPKFDNNGLIKNFELGILNPNKSTKTGSNNESKSKSQLLSKFMYNLSFPLLNKKH